MAGINLGLSPEDLDQWAHSPATQAFRKGLLESIEGAKDAWSWTSYTAETAEATMRLNTSALAQVSALRQVIETIDSYMLQDAAKGE